MTIFKISNLKIRNKLLLIYFFGVLLPIILTDAVILYSVNNNNKEERDKELKYTIERIESNLKERVTDSILFTINMYTDKQLNEFLNKKYDKYIDYYDKYYDLIKNNSLSYNFNDGTLSKIQIYTSNDTILPGGRVLMLNTIEDTEWYKAFKEDDKGIMLYVYYDDSGRNYAGSGSSRRVSIIRKLDYYGKKGFTNILKIDVNYGLMQSDILNEKFDGEIYVRNGDYVLFSNQTGDGGMKPFNTVDSIAVDDNTVVKKIVVNRREWEIVIQPVPLDFWKIITNSKGLIPLILLNILIPSILIYVVGKSITRRLSTVVEHMDEVKKEKFEEIQGITGEDEIGGLIHSYNLMIGKIRNLIQVVFKDQAEKQLLDLSRKQAELKALQSQVNPHFLFNTLESIRMRSLIKGEEETSDIIGELAALFRRSMTWGADYVTISEEIRFIEKYIKIQRYRFGDKIVFNHYVMTGCGEYIVPKLAIGTFVENACVHGLEETDEKGVISLNITKNDRYLFIEISDNGCGIEKEQLESMREKLRNADSSMLNDTKNTGMLNAFLRLKMFSEENILFDIDSEYGQGMDISIRLPLLNHENIVSGGTRHD